MKKIIKSIQHTLWLPLIMTMGISCNSFLEEENITGLTADNYYATQTGVESLVNSLYTPMRFWYGKEDGIAITETGTDLMTRGNGMENPPIALYNSDLAGANEALAFHWERLYSAVNACNAAVTRIPESQLADDMKAIREGEARFLRAFYLWHIVETWGGVHLSTAEVSSTELTANRTPVAQFYEQIFTDLQFAVDHLAESSGDYGRVTRPAAEAFMARMHLTRGNYAEAAALARKVISNYSFSLMPSYADLWDISNIRNPEIVWLVNFTADLILNAELEGGEGMDDILLRDGGNNAHLFFLMTYDQLPGMARDIEYGRPFSRFMPTAFLLDLFDETIDARFDVTFQTVWYCNQPDASQRPEGMEVGDTAILASKYVIPQEVKDASNYTVIDRSRTYNADGSPAVRDRYMSLKKFLDPARMTISQQQGQRDAFVIRLAEMYLIVAEAEMMQGNTEEAVSYMNEVRRRAALPGREAAMEITAAQLNIDFILDERGREFAGEQLRWFDLKRTGKLLERVRAHNPDAAPNIQPFHMVRPIPQAQLDAVTNKEEFIQNEGYN